MEIIDPQSWWGESAAAIENVEIEVRTLGAYSETSIAFDLKLADPFYLEGNDLLEFVFDFQLNEGAVVNDSWLWIDEYISKGEVYEQGEGTQIYESIVDRQQDPSILTQVTSTDYELRVYPLKWDSTRRVRISYLEPLGYYGKSATAELPLGLIKHSEISPENITITVYDDIHYSSESLNSNTWTIDEEGIDYKIYKNNYVIEKDDFEDVPVNYSFKNLESDYFLSTYEGVQDNYYQLVYFPQIDIEDVSENRMIVFDYDSSTSFDSYEVIEDKLRTAMSTMSADDHFIICYSDFSTKFSSEEWTPATPANIDEALSKIDLSSALIGSRLSALLPEALVKVEELNQRSKLLIFSPNNEYYREEMAKSFLAEVRNFYDFMETEVSISVVDYANEKRSEYIDGTSYSGNDYIYKYITDPSHGDYYSLLSGDDISISLADLFMREEAVTTDQFEFHLTVEDGFTYSSFTNFKNELSFGSDQPIISTGKYIGDGLFDVKLSAKIGDEVVTDTQKFDAALSPGLDEMAESIWNAEMIKSLQGSGSQEDKRLVIQTSIAERLLSLHTVFLCLEPDFESISANNNGDGGEIIISTVDEQPEGIKVKIYPNPFIERFTIEFPIQEVTEVDQVTISILDSRGQLVDRFIKSKGLVNGVNKIDWESTFDLTEGLYIVQINVNNEMYNQKVLHIRS